VFLQVRLAQNIFPNDNGAGQTQNGRLLTMDGARETLGRELEDIRSSNISRRWGGRRAGFRVGQAIYSLTMEELRVWPPLPRVRLLLAWGFFAGAWRTFGACEGGV
jgi:hypothetical protein